MQVAGDLLDVPRPSHVFRVVRSDPPTIDDFRSPLERGRHRIDERQEQASGVSVFAQLEQARRHARRYDLGSYIAEIAVPDSMHIERTQRRTAGHFTVWADPDALLGMVVQVTPVEYSRDEEQQT
jgi:hypothetical protein